jgi:uncharacterized protein (DUF1697 family)
VTERARSVALLRGINVGGRRKLPMPDLVAAFVAAGCRDVSTYIQSGNVLFSPPADLETAREALILHLETAVEEAAGFAVPVVVRTGAELDAIAAAQPFVDEDETKLHLAFLGAEPAPDAVLAFSTQAVAPERFALVGSDLYLHLPGGMGRSRLGLAVDRLKVTVTVRNWRTVTTLGRLAHSWPRGFAAGDQTRRN